MYTCIVCVYVHGCVCVDVCSSFFVYFRVYLNMHLCLCLCLLTFLNNTYRISCMWENVSVSTSVSHIQMHIFKCIFKYRERIFSHAWYSMCSNNKDLAVKPNHKNAHLYLNLRLCLCLCLCLCRLTFIKNTYTISCMKENVSVSASVDSKEYSNTGIFSHVWYSIRIINPHLAAKPKKQKWTFVFQSASSHMHDILCVVIIKILRRNPTTKMNLCIWMCICVFCLFLPTWYSIRIINQHLAAKPNHKNESEDSMKHENTMKDT